MTGEHGKLAIYSERHIRAGVREIRGFLVEKVDVLRFLNPKKTPIDSAQKFIKNHPVLRVYYNTVYLSPFLLPKPLDEFGRNKTTRVEIDGYRTATVTSPGEKIITLRPQDLGIKETGEDWEQDFGLRVKGIGVKYPSIAIESPDRQDMTKALSLGLGVIPVELTQEENPVVLPVILDQTKWEDIRPLGGQYEIGLDTGHKVDFLIEHEVGVKFSPFLATNSLPFFAKRQMLLQLANLQEKYPSIRRSFGFRSWRENPSFQNAKPHMNDARAFRIVQELDLIPGNVRAQGFCDQPFDINDAVLRFDAIGITPKQYKNFVVHRYRRDARAHIDAFAKTLRIQTNGDNGKKELVYTQIGELDQAYKRTPQQFAMSENTWLITKDAVLTPTGIYIQDMDSITTDEVLPNINGVTGEEFNTCTMRYFATVIKEYLRVLTRMRITAEVLDNNAIETLDLHAIEQEEYQALLKTLSTSKYYDIQEVEGGLQIGFKTNPPKSTFRTHYIPANYSIVINKGDFHFLYLPEK